MIEQVIHTTLSSRVFKEAPPECPDVARTTKKGASPWSHDFMAYLIRNPDKPKDKLVCLGSELPVCGACPLRIPSYTVKLDNIQSVTIPPHRPFRVPANLVTFNPKPNSK